MCKSRLIMLITPCYKVVAKVLFFPENAGFLRLSRGCGAVFFPGTGCEKRKNRKTFVKNNDLTLPHKKVTKNVENPITRSNLFFPDL